MEQTTSSDDRTKTADAAGPRGVGGWLLLLALVLLINAVAMPIPVLKYLAEESSNLLREKSRLFLVALDALLFLLAIQSFLLLLLKNRSAPKWIASFLIAKPVVCIITLATAFRMGAIDGSDLPMLLFGPQLLPRQGYPWVGGLLPMALGTILWIWYLRRSVRVRNTFV